MPSPDRRRIMIVGVGPHATRFYLPALAAAGPEFGVAVVAAVELEGLLGEEGVEVREVDDEPLG